MKKIIAIIMAVTVLACFFGVTIHAEEEESAMALETVAEEVTETETDEEPTTDRLIEALTILESLTPEQLAFVQEKILGVADATSKLTGWDGFGEFVRIYITPISWVVMILVGIFMLRVYKKGNDTIDGNAMKLTTAAAVIATDADAKYENAKKLTEYAIAKVGDFCDKATDVLTTVKAQAEEVKARNAQMVELADNVKKSEENSTKANLLFAECLNELLQHSKLSDTRKDAIQFKFDQGVALLKNEGDANVESK